MLYIAGVIFFVLCYQREDKFQQLVGYGVEHIVMGLLVNDRPPFIVELYFLVVPSCAFSTYVQQRLRPPVAPLRYVRTPVHFPGGLLVRCRPRICGVLLRRLDRREVLCLDNQLHGCDQPHAVHTRYDVVAVGKAFVLSYDVKHGLLNIPDLLVQHIHEVPHAAPDGLAAVRAAFFRLVGRRHALAFLHEHRALARQLLQLVYGFRRERGKPEPVGEALAELAQQAAVQLVGLAAVWSCLVGMYHVTAHICNLDVHVRTHLEKPLAVYPCVFRHQD